MKRREFLISYAAAAATGLAWGQRPDTAKLDRIAVMSLCFAPLLKGMARPGNPKATLDLMDLAGMVALRAAFAVEASDIGLKVGEGEEPGELAVELQPQTVDERALVDGAQPDQDLPLQLTGLGELLK